MTRETKIGLLIGLGFIVVFAVLLSHTGSELPAGDGMRLASRDTGVSGALPEPSQASRPPRADIGHVNSTTEKPAADRASHAVNISENPKGTESPRSPLANGLPTPDVFGNSPGEWTGSKVPRETTLTGMSSEAAINTTGNTVVKRRIAPPLPVKTPQIASPQPSVRPDSPIVTPPPESTTVEPDTKPEKKAPPTREVIPKEYIVRKGDNLRKISKAEYGRASSKIVDFLMNANKDQINDKDMIVEGQKLMLPPLPPELFEPAPNFDASRLSGNIRTVTSAELSGSTTPRTDQRVAPGLALKNIKTDGQAAGITNNSSPRFRIYEVQDKDNFYKIAKKELGSSSLWPEIKKLNRHIDPKKMQPGMKIKLPVLQPISGTFASQRKST